MTELDENLRIGEAGECVDIAPTALRRWGKSGKLNQIRNPVNGYRFVPGPIS